MKRKTKIYTALIASVLLLGTLCLVLNLVISSDDGPTFTGEAAKYRASLIRAGFPEDYADELTSLHLLHPEWEFVPLLVTELNDDYTWGYVIDRETDDPKTNLVTPESDYSAYRHPTNLKTYDSGFYQASTKTVKYFMDPRNFLNEADIFQFYDVSATGVSSAESIDAVLQGTFMENAKLENGKTYTEYFLELEKALGVDAVYLAVKVRQEQGAAGTSPIISGKCGTLLLSYYKNQTQYTESGKKINPPLTGELESDLLALNGHYNPFNLKATGNGVYEIYKNALEYAVKGTDSMKSAWGGSPSWNTMWKGLYGGSLNIKERYNNRYQSTVYLQKFNVDARAGSANNFTSQYMQNIAGAFTEGRTLYQAFASDDMLDAPCRFLIPVYEGMPDKPSADPANGNCTLYKPASDRFETTVSLTAPEHTSAENKTLFASAKINSSQTLKVSGTLTHSYGISSLEYSWDGKEWIPCSSNGSFNLSLPCNALSYGEHILLIRGESNFDVGVASRKQNRYFLGLVLNVTVQSASSVGISFQTDNSLKTERYEKGSTLALPASSANGFLGWLAPDGSFLPAGEQITVTEDTIYTAVTLDLKTIEGASVLLDGTTNLRFYAIASESDFQSAQLLLPENSFRLMARLTCNNTVGEPIPVDVWEETAVFSNGALQRKLTVDTPCFSSENASDRWSAEFFVELTYSNGSTGAACVTGSTSPRSASQIAYAALADQGTLYSEQARLALQQIVA